MAQRRQSWQPNRPPGCTPDCNRYCNVTFMHIQQTLLIPFRFHRRFYPVWVKIRIIRRFCYKCHNQNKTCKTKSLHKLECTADFQCPLSLTKAWITLPISKKLHPSHGRKIMANKLLFCFLCLSLRLGEAQVSATNKRGQLKKFKKLQIKSSCFKLFTIITFRSIYLNVFSLYLQVFNARFLVWIITLIFRNYLKGSKVCMKFGVW